MEFEQTKQPEFLGAYCRLGCYTQTSLTVPNVQRSGCEVCYKGYKYTLSMLLLFAQKTLVMRFVLILVQRLHSTIRGI
jgi:hypothetical protein